MNELNYDQDINIDPSALDVEWLEQASLMLKYVKNSSRMRANMDNAKEAVGIVKARLDKDIRNNPGRYDIECDKNGVYKVTENLVANTILLQPEYQESTSAFIEAQYEFDMSSGAVRAFEMRKNALENLVRLHGSSYFAGPQIPRDLTYEWTEREKAKKANAKIKIGTPVRMTRNRQEE